MALYELSAENRKTISDALHFLASDKGERTQRLDMAHSLLAFIDSMAETAYVNGYCAGTRETVNDFKAKLAESLAEPEGETDDSNTGE